MEPWSIVSPDPDHTRQAGRALGQSIGADGLVIALIGPLGAGKTVFVKGLAEGLGLDPRAVSSPTFVIAQQYPLRTGPDLLHHIDLYRLESEDELETIGFFDMLAPGGVLACEWADRFPGVLGRDVLRIELDGPTAQADQTEPARRLAISGSGELVDRVATDWQRRFEAEMASKRTKEAEAGRTADLSVIAWLLLSLGLLAMQLMPSLQQVSGRDACAQFEEVASDARGTASMRCAAPFVGRSAGRSAGRSTGSSAIASTRPVEGAGVLLANQRLDLNQAPASQLVLLPGIGPVRAAGIVETRSQRRFSSMLDVERVPGIGPATRQRLARFARVGTTNDG